MKLWIRTQDKTELLECSFFKVCKNRQDIWMILSTNATPLGTYSTKERCLEIIDEIQSLFCDFLICKDVPYSDLMKFREFGCKAVSYFKNENDPSIEYHERSSVVYEMPKE